MNEWVSNSIFIDLTYKAPDSAPTPLRSVVWHMDVFIFTAYGGENRVGAMIALSLPVQLDWPDIRHCTQSW